MHMETQDIITNTIIEALSNEGIDRNLMKKIERKLRGKAFSKELYQKVTKEIFYKLLTEKKLRLAPGFGTVFLKEINSQNKKIFNRKTNEMELREVKGQHKVVYCPGDFIQEFL